MLLQLTVKNFALSEHNVLDFTEGMVCITGETGAGKSLTVDALGLICGQRADSSMVKTGESKAEIEALFSCDGPEGDELRAYLKEHDLQGDEDSLIIRRQISSDGKSRSYVNGHNATLTSLKELSNFLMAIHGQHASIRLLDEHNQLVLLDNLGGLTSLVNEVNVAFDSYNVSRQELSKLAAEQQEGASSYKSLRQDLEKLHKLSLTPQSYDEVNKTFDGMQNLSQIQDAIALALGVLDNDEHNVIEVLESRLNDLIKVSSYDKKNLDPIINLFTEAMHKLDEARISLDNINMQSDPQKMHEYGEKLSLYHDLARKFSISPDKLYTVTKTIEDKLERFLSLKDSIAKQTEIVKKFRDEYEKLALVLSEKRAKSAIKMSKAVTEKIRDLAMPEGQFEVFCERDDEGRPRRFGRDKVEFRFTANRGESVKPLGAVASGGELSRLALTIEVLTARYQSIPTLIFDEVDTGISGRTASAVGALLRELGKSLQVITVTHLPQVAAFANTHFLVDKVNEGESAVSHVRVLEHDDRVHELARMMGGKIVTQATLDSAEDMLLQK